MSLLLFQNATTTKIRIKKFGILYFIVGFWSMADATKETFFTLELLYIQIIDVPFFLRECALIRVKTKYSSVV